MSKPSNVKITIRADIHSCITLGWLGVLLTIWIYGYIRKGRLPNANEIYMLLLVITPILLFLTWLRGFKLTITDKFLEYRDGFYQVSKIPLADFFRIQSDIPLADFFRIQSTIDFKNLEKVVRIPRTNVITRNGRIAFQININVFGIKDFQIILDMLEKSKSCNFR